MKTVGIRELQRRLSEYIRIAQTGERVVITNRGVAVAEFIPPGMEPDDELLRLARAGTVRLGRPAKKKELYRRPRGFKGLPLEEIMEILDWVRADRYP